MKFFISLLSLFLYLNLSAQSKPCEFYENAMRNGNAAFARKDYPAAINEYLTAQTASIRCESLTSIQKEAPAKKLKEVFNTIQKLHVDAVNLLKKVELQKDSTKRALVIADSALAKAEKLINAFYFYDGKFALANKNGKYGFIDKKGDAVIPYRYEKGEQFDYTGFAKVKTIEEFAIPNTNGLKTEYRSVDYLIDASDKQYQVAYQLADLNKDVMALDLRDTRLHGFPAEILPHTQLQILILDGVLKKENNLKTIPKEIQGLQKLEYLSLWNCKIDNLPEEIGQLKELQSLNLSENNLKDLPLATGQLIKLQTLYLTNNSLTKLPDSFRELKSLKVLNLRGNNLAAWPAGLEQLTSLQYLNFSGNGLTGFPVELLRFENLETLDLSFNELTNLPDDINKLKELRNLSLRQNKLTNWPAGVEKLKNLQNLDLSGNRIVNFPSQIPELKNLETLDLSFNSSLKITAAQIDQLKNLRNLRTLRLYNTSIPSSDYQKIRAKLPKCDVIFHQGQ